jgi:hypothetical protein
MGMTLVRCRNGRMMSVRDQENDEQNSFDCDSEKNSAVRGRRAVTCGEQEETI